MISKGNHVKFARSLLVAVSEEANMTSFFFRSMYNKIIIRFGFCDIQNNEGLGKGYQPKQKASKLIILDITKTSSNIFVLLCSSGRDTLRDGIEESYGELRADLNLKKQCVIHNIAP